MGGHYEKDIMKQLQEVMLRLDKTEQEVKDTKKSWKKEVKEVKEKFAVERKQLKSEIKKLKTELNTVKTENAELKTKIKVLENENSKLRSQQNNDSSNSSLPPSTDQKGKKANTYNSREKSKKPRGGQEGHKGTRLAENFLSLDCPKWLRQLICRTVTVTIPDLALMNASGISPTMYIKRNTISV